MMMSCLKLPKFLFAYPFTVLLVARFYALICIFSILFIWYLSIDRLDQSSTFVAIFNLLAMLFLLISLWFTVQKFFYVRLDAILNAISLVFIICGLISATSMTQKSDGNQVFYIILCHLYLLLTQLFSIGWSLTCTHNSVSRLFISDWGKSVTQNEVELLEVDF